MLKLGDKYSTEFTISQEQIDAFAELTGDKNPLHIDPEFAATTNFKGTIAHGIFSAGIISKVLGMEFPGEGTAYLSQKLDFKRPVFPGVKYRADFEITEIREGKHIAIISTKYFNLETDRITLDGFAEVKNALRLP